MNGQQNIKFNNECAVLTLWKEQFQCSHNQHRQHPLVLHSYFHWKDVHFELVPDTTFYLPDTALHTDHLKHKINVTNKTSQGNKYVHNTKKFNSILQTDMTTSCTNGIS
jgi:hypothetical protein